MAGFTLAGAISPGPVNVVALSHGSQGQYPQAIAYVLGASLSYALVVAAMGLAGQSLLAIPAVERSAPWFCAAYLLWLAFHLARAPASADKDSAHTASPSKGQAFFQGAAVQTLTPKAWLVALSGVGLFVIPMTHGGLPFHTALAWFCAVSLLACLLGVGCWALLGQFLVPVLSHARHQRLFNRGLAGMLVLSIAGILAR